MLVRLSNPCSFELVSKFLYGGKTLIDVNRTLTTSFNTVNQNSPKPLPVTGLFFTNFCILQNEKRVKLLKLVEHILKLKENILPY